MRIDFVPQHPDAGGQLMCPTKCSEDPKSLLRPPSPGTGAGGILKGGRLSLRVGQLWSTQVDFVGKGKPYFDEPPPTMQGGKDYPRRPP